jgi:hypothetical protein
MPKEIAHIHLAGIVLERCHPELRPHLKNHERIYNYGSVAPDLFYYDLTVYGEKSQVAWGEIIHGRDAEDTMLHVVALLDQSRMLREIDPLQSSRLLAFACGFLTHIAMDTIFHPYVYSSTGNYYASDPVERKHAESRHRLFETCMDYHILKLRRESLKEFRLSERIALNEEEKRTVLTAYADALRSAHQIDVDPDHVHRIVNRAFKKANRIIALFQNRPLSRFAVWLNRGLNGLLDPIANACYGPHRAQALLDFENLPAVPHPVTGEQMSGGDVRNMIEKAVDRSVQFVNASCNYWQGRINLADLRKVLRPYSLNNGLERVQTSAMQYSRVLPELLLR